MWRKERDSKKREGRRDRGGQGRKCEKREEGSEEKRTRGEQEG